MAHLLAPPVLKNKFKHHLCLKSANVIICIMYKKHKNGTMHLSHFAPWWRYQMETFSAFLSFVRGIHRSSIDSPYKGQWRGSFDIFFDMRPNKQLSKQLKRRWSDTPAR